MTAATNTARSKMIDTLCQKFGASVAFEMAGSQPTLITDKVKVRDLLLFLKTAPDFGKPMLTDLFPVDCFPKNPRFEVVYLLTSLDSYERLVIKARLNDGERLASVSDIFASAGWLEREAFDMFGIRFDNHPDMRRILMVEDFDGYPLRKDFPTEGYGFDKPFKVELEEEKR
jgi:NADH-quinone oxidoreductase subunit C